MKESTVVFYILFGFLFFAQLMILNFAVEEIEKNKVQIKQNKISLEDVQKRNRLWEKINGNDNRL